MKKRVALVERVMWHVREGCCTCMIGPGGGASVLPCCSGWRVLEALGKVSAARCGCEFGSHRSWRQYNWVDGVLCRLP